MFFFCGFVPVWWLAFYIMRVLTVVVESRFFPFKQVLYYIIGVRVSDCLYRCQKGSILVFSVLLLSPVLISYQSAADESCPAFAQCCITAF